MIKRTVLFAALIVAGTNTALAVSVTLEADAATVTIGEPVAFDYVMDFSEDSTIGGGTDFFYDPTVLQFTGWTFDPELTADEVLFRRAPTDCTQPNDNQGCTIDADEFGPGLAQANGLSFGNSAGAGIAGPELIGQLHFVAVGPGMATIMMAANDDGVPGNPGPFVSGNSFQIQTVDFIGDSVTVEMVASDIDEDGVPDNIDNCTDRANASQRDTDGDGFGNDCDADLNGDCIVNAVDLGLFRSRFFSTDADADFDGSGSVNVSDLGILRLLFFMPPGPSGLANICDQR